jgi:PAS domain S-box-containing protein
MIYFPDDWAWNSLHLALFCRIMEATPLGPARVPSHPGAKPGTDIATAKLLETVGQRQRWIGVGNLLVGLLLLSLLSSEVSFTTKAAFVVGSGLLAAARFLPFRFLHIAFAMEDSRLFGWYVVAIDIVSGLFWSMLFYELSLSPVATDLPFGILGVGLTVFPHILQGCWLPLALAYPFSVSLGASSAFAIHWTTHSPGLLAMIWAGFGLTAWLAYRIGQQVGSCSEFQARLASFEVRFRQIVEANPVPSAVLRRNDGQILFANTRLSDLLGIVPQERSLWDIVARREERQALVTELQGKGVIDGRETVLAPRPGTHLVTHLSLRPLENDGEPLLMLTIKDITHDMDLQKAQISARMAAEQALAAERRAVEEQRHFLAMVAHEFRTPLSIISTTMDVLEMTADAVRPEAAPAYDRIRRATERLVRLIETCLNEDRLVDIGTLTREPINLVQLLKGVVHDSRGGTNAAKVDASLPEQPITIIGDKALLKIALANLVDNAEKYTKADGRIALRLTPYGDLAVIQVSDNGMGIPESELPRIFDKYYRAPGAKGIAGAGLGLNLVKRIIELHGGGIEAASVHGQGSTFTVRLPIAKSDLTNQNE